MCLLKMKPRLNNVKLCEFVLCNVETDVLDFIPSTLDTAVHVNICQERKTSQ